MSTRKRGREGFYEKRKTPPGPVSAAGLAARKTPPDPFLAAGLAALIVASACNRTETAAPPPTMPPTPVALAVAHAEPVDEATEYVATLKSLHSTTIQP